jgi:hypothetical protein
MATLYISYYGGADKGVAVDPIGAEALTTSGTSATISGVVPDGTGIIKFNSDAAHYIDLDIGTPVAAAGRVGGSSYVAANEVFWLRTASASRAALKVAAITV